MKKLKSKKYSVLRTISKYSFVIVFIFTMTASFVLAVDGGAGNGGADGGAGNGTNITTTINNPLGDNLKDIPSFIEALITIVLTVGIPVVVLAIIYTGFLFVSASGNPEKLKKAKSALVYTLIGAALLLGAFVIAKAIGSTVDEIKNSA